MRLAQQNRRLYARVCAGHATRHPILEEDAIPAGLAASESKNVEAAWTRLIARSFGP